MTKKHLFSEYIEDVEELLNLESEEIGEIILVYLNSLDDYHAKTYLNTHTFSSLENFENYPKEKQELMKQVIMEGWQFLINEGFLAPRPESHNDGWMIITRKGKKINSLMEMKVYKQSKILPKNFLHKQIEKKAWAPFIRGDYETAVFSAFKELEITVRKVCNYPDTDYGENLMRKAFHKMDGPLTDLSLPESERLAVQHLFARTYGFYRNPLGHKEVTISNPIEAAEMIIFASHLLKIVDSRKSPSLPIMN